MPNTMTATWMGVGAGGEDRSIGVGDLVRVKAGTPDPDFPDLALDGCTGEVIEIDGLGTRFNYLVQWNDDTTRRLGLLCRDRCENADVALDRMWLFEEDFEPPPL